MDRKTTLLNKLEKFKKECEKQGRTLDDFCLEEAFPGDNSTSFVLKVKAGWLDGLSLSEGLDILFDILWDSTSVSTRTEIFSICVVNSADEFDCQTVSNFEVDKAPTALKSKDLAFV